MSDLVANRQGCLPGDLRVAAGHTSTVVLHASHEQGEHPREEEHVTVLRERESLVLHADDSVAVKSNETFAVL
ncbi:hypothetical protein [Streptomyces sp. NPDC048340]|uniref:hypothetical protein n=1 Tax=Streptomyces sp. NPDC048340 TaxID=3365537 RepID=UPI0037219AF9